MKKAIFCWLAFLLAGTVYAQDINEGNNHAGENENIDALLPRFSLDANLKGGLNSQNLTLINYSSGYTNPVNVNISNPKYTGGSSFGIDIQGGYFFDKKHHWGIGTGIQYMEQSGTLTMDNYHMEYQSTLRDTIFRQLVTADQPIKEKITSTNINIPLVLKYKHQLGRRLGVAVDAGIVYNVMMENKYSTNAIIDYEAIYKLTPDAGFVYDNSPIPNSNDVFFTKAAYTTNADAVLHINQLRSLGYNVGLGVSPNSNTGSVSYTAGSIGMLLKPSLSYRINKSIYLDLGVYYMSQTFKGSGNNYQLTDKVGSYSSLLNAETKVMQSGYGINLGARFYFYNKKSDRDGDGVVDNRDKCPDVFGLAQFDGCPDGDGDGVPDVNDSCPTQFGLIQFNGCPDSDGDGIPDKNDACPLKAGLAQFNGCPDTDGDGIADKDDICPFQAGPAKFNGCPDTDGDGIPDNLDKCPNAFGPVENQGCPYDTVKPVVKQEVNTAAPVDVTPSKEREVAVVEKVKNTKKEPKKDTDIEPSGSVSISAPVLFDINKSTIRETSKPIIAEAVKKIQGNSKAFIIVEGYTDTTGSASYNKVLSQMRASVLKKYLIEQGVSPDRIKSVGMGSKVPLGDNKSREGRMKNRRAEMKWGN